MTNAPLLDHTLLQFGAVHKSNSVYKPQHEKLVRRECFCLKALLDFDSSWKVGLTGTESSLKDINIVS